MRRGLLIANILLLLGLAGATAYLFVENRDLSEQVTLTNEEKNQRLVDEVNKVYDLPDETPVIGVVRDVDEFKTEFPAFANDDVQLDDTLLFFRKARLNVLYRPSENRVVKTYNVQIPIAIEVIGSEKAIEQMREKLGEFGNSVTIVSRVDNNVTQAFVFDVDGDQESDAVQLAEQLDLEIGSTLPSSITPDPTTEIVILAVEDKNSSPAPSNSEQSTEE